jgi:LEA14-like dessication related protein
LTGCAGIQKIYDPPQIKLANIRMYDSGKKKAMALETAFLIDLRIFNTSEIPLHVKGIDCELGINGKPFATGVGKADVTIDAYATDVVSVVVYSSVLDTVNRFIDMVGNVQKKQKIENPEYTLSGRLKVGGGTPLTSTMPFETRGELNFDVLTGGKGTGL